jgi:predicted enzyme related to lactoylglutathione lyase
LSDLQPEEDFMSAPNLFLVYVQDAHAASAFYSDLFEMEPSFVSPRYIAFEVAPGVLFAVWTGHNERAPRDDRSAGAIAGVPRMSEVGLMVPGPPAAIDQIFTKWQSKGITVVEEPHDEVFGRTFVVADPDGNLIRVAPVD